MEKFYVISMSNCGNFATEIYANSKEEAREIASKGFPVAAVLTQQEYQEAVSQAAEEQWEKRKQQEQDFARRYY